MSRPADCHPEKPNQGHGLCAACYQRSRYTGKAMPSLRVVDDAEPIDPDAPRCDICADHESKLIRFNLVVRAQLPDGRPTSRGAGAITLCGRCWASCRRKAQPQKRRRVA